MGVVLAHRVWELGFRRFSVLRGFNPDAQLQLFGASGVKATWFVASLLRNSDHADDVIVLVCSWVVISRVITRVTIRITLIRGLITPLMTTPEPSRRGAGDCGFRR